MSEFFAPDLQKIIINSCNDLYANRKLITKKVVTEIVTSLGDWSQQELELLIPQFINEWRLQNIAEDENLLNADRIVALEAQVSKYRVNLMQSQRTIVKLKMDLIALSTTAQRQRDIIIADLRDILGVTK